MIIWYRQTAEKSIAYLYDYFFWQICEHSPFSDFFGKNLNYILDSWLTFSEQTLFFQLSNETENFWETSPSCPKKLDFYRKKRWFLLSKMECVNECLQNCKKKTWPTAGFETVTSGLRTAVTPKMCIVEVTNESSDFNSARYGQFNYRLN